MNAVAARRSGAPSPSIRMVSLVLAALASGLALLVLLLGLSIRTLQAMREAPVVIELIPLPTPEPPPPPIPGARKVLHRPDAAAPAPATAAPPPATPVTVVPVVAAPPAPVTAPISRDGERAGSGSGDGAGGAGRGGSGTGSGELLPPSWVTEAGYRELAPHNPPLARNERINGTVLLACHVRANQRTANCRVVYEKPRGYGFGKAGLRAAPSFRLNPPMREGRADETAWVGIPISFNNRK